MYQLVRAVGKPISKGSHWSDVEISDVPMVDLYRQYQKIYAVLKDPFMVTPEALDLADIRKENISNSDTFGQFLVKNANNALPTSERLPTVRTRYVHYADGHRAGYKIKPVAQNASPDAEFPSSDKRWLHLSHSGIDFEDFKKYALVTINGYFHFADVSSAGAWIVDGMTTCRNSKDNQIGIYSFKNIGGIRCLPIKRSMISPLTTKERGEYNKHGTHYDGRTYIDSSYGTGEGSAKHRLLIDTKLNLKNKTVGIVIGGYLHLIDEDVIRRYNDTTVILNLMNVPVVERYLESRNDLDYSSMPFDRNPELPSVVNVVDFLQDENLFAYLTLSQSFLVIIDNPDIYTKVVPADIRVGKGNGIAYSKPNIPLMSGCGKMCEYWPVHETGHWSIAYTNYGRYNRVFRSTTLPGMQNVNDGRVPMNEVQRQKANWFYIATDI